jgi:hypothetical protein
MLRCLDREAPFAFAAAQDQRTLPGNLNGELRRVRDADGVRLDFEDWE